MKSDSTRGRPKTVGRPDAAGGRDVFAALEQLVGPLERSLPGSAEVVLHDLAALPDSIIAIEGDITGRRPGDPATDRLLEAAAGGDLRTRIGYRTTSPTGRSLLSTTIIIRDAEDRPVAALCINRDVTDWTIIGDAARSILGREELLAPDGAGRGTAGDDADGRGTAGDDADGRGRRDGEGTTRVADGEAFARDVDELAAVLLQQAVEEQDVPVSLMRKVHKVDAVRSLKRRGFFMLRDAVEMAARALGVTRFTIYNYLNEIEEINGSGESAAREGGRGSAPAASGPPTRSSRSASVCPTGVAS